MIDRFFNMLDWGCDTFLKGVIALLFIGFGVFLVVTAGTLGLCLFFVFASFLKWAFADSGAAPVLDEEEA